ncbi:MAG: Imidazole glycerol phosphate synthase subunit HisH [Nitrospira sp.]|nr:Imidazole glycerol phosphate synthase subunit HisH [Nitrospira sp.]
MSAILVLDYGSGNVQSVYNAMRRVSGAVVRGSSPAAVRQAKAVVVPGVGAFSGFMVALDGRGLTVPLRQEIHAGKHVLGICVGMQAFAQAGSEPRLTPGLGIVDGTVESLRNLGVATRRIPHVGWNGIRISEDIPKDSPLRVLENRDVYFMHSYGFPAETPSAVGWTDYEIEFCSVISTRNAMGIQFHPEKSQQAGLDFLDAWVRSVVPE